MKGKNYIGETFHFITAALQCCLQDMVQTLHTKPFLSKQDKLSSDMSGEDRNSLFSPALFPLLHQHECLPFAALHCTAVTSHGQPWDALQQLSRCC